MPAKSIPIKNLEELYAFMQLPVEEFDVSSGFTIHYLQKTFKELPFRSIAFRPNYFSFLFIKEAFGAYTIDDHTFKVTPSTVYFTNPGNYRIFEWHKITDVCLITFNESYLKEHVHADVYTPFAFLLTETVAPRKLIKEQFSVIQQLYKFLYLQYHSHSPYKDQIIGSMMVTLLLKIKEYFFQDYNPIYEGNRGSQIVNTFKRDMEQHFRDLLSGKADHPLRVQDYADRQSLHVNYLSSVIKNKTGKSISRWITDRTITEAKVLLQHNELTIKEIGYRLGFLESAHFSNYFRKHGGASPAVYRRRYFSEHP